ncbi:MAG TPA: OmpA family protein, partial [Candidatus Kapabacteria bacterium]|nr:OmpA family protein [Candidatus Kapabacteria bacterium]
TWEIVQNPIPKLEQEAIITLTVEDNENQVKKHSKNVTIHQKTIRKKREIIEDDYRIERYSLILFDFDKSTILDIHKPVLDYIRSKITPNSKVKIYGYADRTGTLEYNRELARRRSEEVRNYLKINPENVEVYPIGSDELLFDNNIPEGRSYSRTVKIEIRTPIF